jgi:hypothetical protein
MTTRVVHYKGSVPVPTVELIKIEYFEPQAAPFEAGKYCCAACGGPMDTHPRLSFRVTYRGRGNIYSAALCDDCASRPGPRRDRRVARYAGAELLEPADEAEIQDQAEFDAWMGQDEGVRH